MSICMKTIFVYLNPPTKLGIKKLERYEINFPKFLNVNVMLLRSGLEKSVEKLKATPYYERHYYRLFHWLAKSYASNELLPKILEKTGFSYKVVCKDFKFLTGCTPGEYIILMRVYWALFLMQNSELPINQIAYECGFATLSNFRQAVKRYTGKSAREVRGSPQGADHA